MQRGDQVMVRTFLNQPLQRRVWEAGVDLVVLCTEDSFIRWEAGGVEPIGSPVAEDMIFAMDQGLFDEMKVYDEQLDDLPTALIYLWEQARQAN